MITLYVFTMVMLIGAPAAFTGNVFAYGLLSAPTLLLLSMGLLNVSFQFLRSRGLQLSRDASVTMMLYSEICFGFFLGVVVLRQPMFYTAVVGALLIVGGSALHHEMKRTAATNRP